MIFQLVSDVIEFAEEVIDGVKKIVGHPNQMSEEITLPALLNSGKVNQQARD